jgi:hypothetical protein
VLITGTNVPQDNQEVNAKEKHARQQQLHQLNAPMQTEHIMPYVIQIQINVLLAQIHFHVRVVNSALPVQNLSQIIQLGSVIPASVQTVHAAMLSKLAMR